MCYFNPLDNFYKSQIGAIVANKKTTFRVKGEFDSVVFVYKKDGDETLNYCQMQKDGDIFSLDIAFDRGLYFYRFITNLGIIGLGRDYKGVIENNPSYFQLTAYDKDYSVPEWLSGGVIYQIFPDRFCRAEKDKCIEQDKILRSDWGATPVYRPNEQGKVMNNDFFGGDLQGIISKIPYLKELGVTAIYLNPIFKAFSNHRYDTGDYMTIDPILGTEKDLVELIDKAKNNGIKIILDGVFNHTGDDSLYFNKYGKYDSVGAYQSKNSPYVDWFNFINYPNVYDSWWGITTLPAVNENSSSYVQFITGENGVLDYYTKLGVSGWRLDVVDELPAKFVRNIRKAVKSANPDATIIGEVWEDASNKIAYGVRREYFQGKELDGVMNYPLKNAILNFVKYGDEKGLSWTIKEQIDHYPKFVLDNVMNILSTHDTARLITVLSGLDMNGKSKDEMAKTFIPSDMLNIAKNKVKIASLLQYTLCGVPSLYYGDEIGMQGYIDPLNRKCYPWENQDQELLKWYAFLGKLREDYSAFKHGDFAEIYADKGAYIFKRFSKDNEVLIAVNCGRETIGLEFNDKLFNLIEEKEYVKEFALYPNMFAVLIKIKK